MDTKNTSRIIAEGFKMGVKKKFDKEFKEQVILHIISEETTVSTMAEKLGTLYSTIKCKCSN